MSCTIDDCERPVKARGWCGTHHQRWLRHGDVRATEPVGSQGYQSGSDHPDWRGDDIGYQAWHVRLRQRSHGSLCDHCGLVEPTQWAFNWRDVPHDQWKFDPFPYTTRFEDYLDLCVSCHRRFDWERRKGVEKGSRKGIE